MDTELIGLLVVLLAPTLFWGTYHYVKDRRRPEPIRYLGFAYLLGIAAGLLGQLAYRWLNLFGLRQDAYALAETDPASLLLYAVVVIGGIEETVKLLPFVWIVLRLKHFDELMDGIIYASFIALGFATYENFVYARYVGGIELLARSIASPLVHVLFASVWGHLIARADCRGRPLLPAVLLGLAAAAMPARPVRFHVDRAAGRLPAARRRIAGSGLADAPAADAELAPCRRLGTRPVE